MRDIFSLLTAMLLLPLSVLASEQPQPDDFAAALSLEGIKSKTAIHRVRLPAAVYTGSVRSDLGDVRIFNAAGHPVPQLLRRPQSVVHHNERRRQLAIFPLYQENGELNSDNLRLQLQQGMTATTIRVTAEKETKQKQRVNGYLIVVPREVKTIDALDLDWPESMNDVMASATVDMSRDLNSWQPLVKKAIVTRKFFNEKTISQQRIVLHPALKVPSPQNDSPLYLRLLWINPAHGIDLRSISGISRITTEKKTEYHWQSLLPESRPQLETGIYEYDSHGHFPVDSIRLHFSHLNSAYTVDIFSKDEPEHVWQLCYHGTFSHLGEIDSGEQDVTLSGVPRRSRYWQVALRASMLELSEGPTLKLGWRGDELLFLAKGQPPYILAYGAASLTHEQLARQSPLLLDILAKKPLAPLQDVLCGKEFVLGGDARRRPPASSLPWKIWSLWVLLVAGVAVIGWMAFLLFRDRSGIGKRER